MTRILSFTSLSTIPDGPRVAKSQLGNIIIEAKGDKIYLCGKEVEALYAWYMSEKYK